jgi:drug/metabolite transporter (DMT)-like permease
MTRNLEENKTAAHSLLLFVAACIWGMAFVSQSKGMEYMHPFTFNGVRTLIGALVLFIYILCTGRLKRRYIAGINKKVTIRTGILCGIALTVGSTLQQVGLKYTTVGKAGFITTLYIIFVPIGGLIVFKKRVSPVVWLAAVMAAAGLYLLCMTESLSVGTGDILVFLCAIVYTGHIMIVDANSAESEGVIVSCIQLVICGTISTVAAFIWGNPDMGQIMDGLGSLLYAGVLSSGLAYTLQIVGQKGVNPTVAALIMSLESVVATIAGWVSYKIGLLNTDQSLTVRQAAGCAIVFAAVILVQLPEEWFKKIKRNILNKFHKNANAVDVT